MDVVVGSLPQDFFGDGTDLMNVSKEVDDVLRTGQRKIPKHYDAIETVVYKSDEVAKQLRERFRRSSPIFLFARKMVARRTDGIKRTYLQPPSVSSTRGF